MQKFSQYYALFISVFRIRAVLGRIRIRGFVNLLTDPAPDPDPALFVSGFEDANKKKISTFFGLFIQHCFNCLRFFCVGGCWDRTQATCDYGID
jgi:hypothetical protein